MNMFARILSNETAKDAIPAALAATVLAITFAENAKADGTMVTKAPPIPDVSSSAYNWNGFYAGGQLGYAWGRSSWTARPRWGPNISGSFRTIDIFSQSGSFFGGLQAGYNYMLPNRVVIGAEVDATFPARAPGSVWHLHRRISNLSSPTLGRKPLARLCWLPAPRAAASATRRAAGCFTRPAASPGPTTGCH